MRARCLAVIGLLVACSPAQLARAGDDRPAWVERGAGGKYPDGLYLVGVGVGDTRADASDRARAEIAKRFKVAVHQDVTVRRSVASSEDATGSAWLSDSSTRETTRTATDQTLEDVAVAETWSDPTSARVHALAVLHRGSAAERIALRLREIDQEITAALDDADRAIGVRALGHVLEARAAADRRAALREPLAVLDAATWTETAPVVAITDLDRRIALLAGAVPVAVEVTPPDSPSAADVRSALSRAVTRGGLQLVDEATRAAVVVRVVLTEQPVARANRDFAFWSITARFELADMAPAGAAGAGEASARVIGAGSFEHREGALDERDARLRASSRLQGELVASFFEELRGFFKQ